MSVQTGSVERPVRYRDKSLFGRIFIGFCAILFPIATWWIANGIQAPPGPARVLALAIGLILLATVALGVGLTIQPRVTLTADTLRIPRAFRTATIPIPDIAGVGLVFVRSNPAYAGNRVPSGWRLMVWRSTGQVERSGIWDTPFVYPSTKPGARRRRNFGANNFDPVAGTDPEQLASTHAALVAHDIYTRVLSRQGPFGPLAVKQLQKHLPAPSPWAMLPMVAYWSPDGAMGYAGRPHPSDP